MRLSPLRSVLAILFVTLFVASCRSTSGEAGVRVVRPGSPGQETRVVQGEEAIGERLPHTEADVRFMQQMIPHHVQALVMSDLVPARTSRSELLMLAERIKISQLDEIALMQSWLEHRGESVPSLSAEHMHHEEVMPGMLTDEQMERLASADGIEFDRLFVSAMIHHHEGALTMVAELFASPGAAQEEDIFQIASHVEEDQTIEIARMNRLLNELMALGY